MDVTTALPVALGAAAVVHGVPALTVLGALSGRQPESLPWGTCRWRGPATRRQVALTFDDGPSPGATARTLELLGQLGAKATFFVTGGLAEAHPELVQEMRRQGHAVGLHGYRHEHHLLHTGWWIWRDLRRAAHIHRQVLGEQALWFRPPHGQLAAGSMVAAARLGLRTVLWSGWGREFADPSPERVLHRLSARLEPGAILLQHDNDETCPPGTAAITHGVLPVLVEELQSRQLAAVTLDELVDRAPVEAP